ASPAPFAKPGRMPSMVFARCSWGSSPATKIANGLSPIRRATDRVVSSYKPSIMSEREPHLLVVDDDLRLLELLRRYLSDNGFRVSTAGDAGEARANLASFAFDLAVLDVMLPGETGLDLTRALRREGRVPVLLLTAAGEPEERINGLEQGAEDYLTKPFEPR